jgi:hypothetical protein
VLTLRKVGPPNFRVWALKGAKVTLLNNRFSNWRHALHASESESLVSGNTINDFHKTAVVINKLSKPPVGTVNKAVSSEKLANVATIDGIPLEAGDNRIENPSNREPDQ